MQRSTRFAALSVGIAVAAIALAGCGSSGSSGTQAPPTTVTSGAAAAGAGCAPVPDSKLVVLTDDKHLQLSDNLVAAYNKSVDNPALVAALNKVNATVDQDKLLALNKAVDSEHQTPAAAAAAFATANNLTAGLAKGPGGKVTVGSGGFGEAQELAELYKIALTAAGYDVKVQSVGNREAYLKPLEQGQIQVMPEYAASLTNALATAEGGASATLPASADINTTMTALKDLGGKVNLLFGTPSTATDVNAFAVTQATATKYGLATLSDFAAKCSGKASTLAGPAECPQRPFCQEGLQKTYGITFGEFKTMGTDAGGPITKKALTSGEATIGLVFSSDSTFAQ
jgi:osmoprotectant transport system substrate-binding protein